MNQLGQASRADVTPDPSSARRTADVLVDILISKGVTVIFGLPGGPISPIHDALMDRPEIRVITTRHESGAMFAAAGYAQTSGKLGVALVTSGPGALNAMTGLASAFCDGLPVLLLVGEVPRRVFGRGALQDGSAYHLNIVAIASHISKFAAEIGAPDAAPAVLQRAVATALSGKRGPVALTLPIDTTMSKIVPPEIALEVSTTLSIPEAALKRAAGLLSDSERTVIFAGSGVRRAGGPTGLRQFAERLQCPVITTPKGKGVFPEDHPLSLGVFGIGGHLSSTAFLKQGVDVLVGVGTSFNELATESWSSLLRPRRAFIHVDIDARQLGRSYPVTLGIAAPADLFFAKMLELLPQARPQDWGGLRYHSPPDVPVQRIGHTITPQRAFWEMQQVLPCDTIYTCDMGEHSVFATHYLRTVSSDGFILMNGLGSMGSSIGAALGAKLAHPHRSVAAICGDGCFAMNAFEVATAVAEEIPIIVFVMNDERMGMVEIGHAAVYGRTPSYSTLPMKVAELAASLGAESFSVYEPGQILASNLELRSQRVPQVVDVHIDPTVRMPKKDRFDAAPEGAAPSSLH